MAAVGERDLETNQVRKSEYQGMFATCPFSILDTSTSRVWISEPLAVGATRWPRLFFLVRSLSSSYTERANLSPRREWLHDWYTAVLAPLVGGVIVRGAI